MQLIVFGLFGKKADFETKLIYCKFVDFGFLFKIFLVNGFKFLIG